MLLSAIYPTNFRRESRVLNTNTTYSAQSTTFSKTFATPAQDTLSLSSANTNLSGISNITFCGKKIILVDGGEHANNMAHFSRAINEDSPIDRYSVTTNPKDENLKQLESLASQLQRLENADVFGEYIAIPALASVPLLNLQDQYNAIMYEDKKFTPENIKSERENILQFLEKLYKYPQNYRKHIGYMDPVSQGIQYAYPVIKSINNLVAKGAKVYIPSGHPHDVTLKYFAKERGLNAELYHFISTGEDIGGNIGQLFDEIKSQNWYDFNLLALSNANVIGVKDAKGEHDYLFAAYDSCITDGERGVYNFSPVRKNGDLKGFSYTDKSTVQYPSYDFPFNEKLEKILPFVGKKYNSVAATPAEIRTLKATIKRNGYTENCADKLYPVEKIFSKDYIIRNKIKLKGDYVDKSLSLFFRTNNRDEVIFPKCDCEGSGKPSVISMWGSCFSVFNAIAKDIELEKNSALYPEKYISYIEEAESYDKRGLYKLAADCFNRAIKIQKAYSLKNPTQTISNGYGVYYMLGNLHYKNKHYDEAASCYNKAINALAKEIIADRKAANNPTYADKIKNFFYNTFEEQRQSLEIKVQNFANLYTNISNICKIKNEDYPYRICRAAISDIEKGTSRGNKIIEKRAQGISYIGNLYPEIAR